MERTSGNLSIKAVVLLRFVRADSDVFEVAFGIARVYDDQLKDSATAVRYYGEALAVLEAISTEATDWSAYMRDYTRSLCTVLREPVCEVGCLWHT